MACSLLTSEILQRKLELFIKNILKSSGIILGFFCIRKTHESRYESGSKLLWWWSNSIILLQLYFLFKMYTFYLINFNYSSTFTEFLAQILGLITGYTFAFAMLFHSFVVFFKKETVVQLINEMIELDYKVLTLTQSFEHKLNFMIFVLIKIVFDVILIVGLMFTTIVVYSKDPISKSIYYEYIIIFPIAVLSYSFIVTFYYVSYLWITDLLQKIENDLLKMNLANRFNNVQNKHKLFNFSCCVQSIHVVGNKVNQLFEFTFLLILLEIFIAVVNEVSRFSFFQSIFT